MNDKKTIIQYRDEGLKNPDRFYDYVKHFRNVKNSPYACSMSDLKPSLEFLVFCQLGPGEANPNKKRHNEIRNNFRKKGVIRNLISEQQDRILHSAKFELGTHTAKIPHTTTPSPASAFWDDAILKAAFKSTFVSSASTLCRQRLGAAGNAKLARAQRFLSTRLEIDGQIVELATEIAKMDVVYKTLLEIGFDKDVLDELVDILTDRVVSNSNDQPPMNCKQLLWPTEAGDVAITPLHPFAMHVEISARLAERREDAKWIKRTHTKVGGAQPQNSGFINSDFNGQHPLLEADPPKVVSYEQRNLHMVCKNGKISLGRPSKTSVKSISTQLQAHSRTNRTHRDNLEGAIRNALVGILHPFISIRNAISADSSHDIEAITHPVWAKALISDGYASVVPYRADLLDEITNRLVASIPPEVMGSGSDPDDVKSLISKVSDKLISDVFKRAA